VKEIYKRGGRTQEMMEAISEKTIKKGKADSASAGDLRKIGLAIKEAIRAARPSIRARVLARTDRLVLGNGYGGEFEASLP
jgi:hypothetical protein